MSLYASLGTSRVVSARLTTPAWGCAVADVMLAEDDLLTPGPQLLTIGNLALLMSIVRDSSWAGSRSVRLVGGFGGWRNDVAARFYASALGVGRSMVLKDAAAEVGELLGTVTDESLGPFFARSAAPASRLLAVLVGRAGWYVDIAGVTQIGERAPVPVTSEFTPTEYQPHLGLVTIATEDPLAWQPGAVFAHDLLPLPAYQVASTTLELGANGTLRLQVMMVDA